MKRSEITTTTKATAATGTIQFPKEVEAAIEKLVASKINEMTLSEFVSGKTTKADPDPVSEASVEEIRETIKNCKNRTTISEVEKRMTEWHDTLFAHQLEMVNRLNPITAFMVGAMATGGNFSEISGLIANRIMGDIGPYEFITKITRTCSVSESEHEALEGLVKLFQGLIDKDVCDSRITSTKEELEAVLNNF